MRGRDEGERGGRKNGEAEIKFIANSNLKVELFQVTSSPIVELHTSPLELRAIHMTYIITMYTGPNVT